MNVYFADPYSPWQRGTNENINGLLRQHFPRGIDWQKVANLMFATVVGKLNNRPLRCLNYQTPNEVFLKSTGDTLTICNPPLRKAWMKQPLLSSISASRQTQTLWAKKRNGMILKTTPSMDIFTACITQNCRSSWQSSSRIFFW